MDGRDRRRSLLPRRDRRDLDLGMIDENLEQFERRVTGRSEDADCNHEYEVPFDDWQTGWMRSYSCGRHSHEQGKLMMNNADNQHVFRQSRIRAFVVAIFGGGFCIWGGVTLLRSDRWHVAWIPFVLAVLVILYAIHLWVSQVVVDDQGIVFRGLFRQTQIPWSEVQFWKADRDDAADVDGDFVHIERICGQSPLRIYEFMVARPGIDAFFESIRQHGRSAALQESK